MKTGVISMGLQCPIVKKGDNIADIVINTLTSYIADSTISLNDKDVICITESIVARAQGNYVTTDDIVQFLNENNAPTDIVLYSPIMSRNRFSVILRGIARYAVNISIILNGNFDEQGNPNYGKNLFTGVDIQDYYKQIADEEHCDLTFEQMDDLKNQNEEDFFYRRSGKTWMFIDARCHNAIESKYTLKWLMSSAVKRKDGNYSGYNADYGVLGSNKADDETLKLFPRNCFDLCKDIQLKIKNQFGKQVEVLVYGDGCFKDPIGGIWEFADPVTCPGYTSGLFGTPNELKLKALADGKFSELSGDELRQAIQNEIKTKDSNLIGNMASQGTTPRRYVDLLASLADLTSGSGDKGTPIVLIKNYFTNYAE